MTTIPHSEIRTYTFAESSGHPGGFALKTLESIYNGPTLESEKPHRHDYYAIVFIEQGTGVHYIDFNAYTVTDSSIFFLTPGQMHQLLFFAEPKGYVLLFTEDFLVSNAIPQRLLDDLYLFNEYGVSPPLAISEEQLSAYLSLIKQMDFFTISIDKYNTEALASLVQLFLILGNNHCSLKKEDALVLAEGGNSILRNFKSLLNKRFAQQHQVSYYADELAVSADHLNKTVKSLTGVSAKEHIQNKLIIESKRSLLFSDISNKELAFEMGFEEAAHFNNFFKKMTGMSPGEFRSAARSGS
jgi:AraC family transcriptional regulator, transcriptional activator of pobA